MKIHTIDVCGVELRLLCNWTPTGAGHKYYRGIKDERGEPAFILKNPMGGDPMYPAEGWALSVKTLFETLSQEMRGCHLIYHEYRTEELVPVPLCISIPEDFLLVDDS